MGLPLPAESLLILLSLFASKTHHISIEAIAACAIIGAVIGDNIGYGIGHYFGYRLLNKHGHKIGLHDHRRILGRYLFRHYGGMAIFFGRFVAFLRIFIALLAGASRMPWHSFLIFNIIGGFVWGLTYSTVPYLIGQQIDTISGPFGIIMAVIIGLILIAGFFFIRHHEQQLIERALAEEKQIASEKNVQKKTFKDGQ